MNMAHFTVPYTMYRTLSAHFCVIKIGSDRQQQHNGGGGVGISANSNIPHLPAAKSATTTTTIFSSQSLYCTQKYDASKKKTDCNFCNNFPRTYKQTKKLVNETRQQQQKIAERWILKRNNIHDLYICCIANKNCINH